MSKGTAKAQESIAFKPLGMVPPSVDVERRGDGTILLASRYAPAEAPRSIPHLLYDRAKAWPDRAFMKERRGADAERGRTRPDAHRTGRQAGAEG